MVLSVVVSQQGTLTLLAPKKVCLFLHSFCIRCRKFFWIGYCLFSGAWYFCEKISATVYEFESNIMFDRRERDCPHAGWAPQSFKSSRKARADKREQNAYDFMDEDEKAVIAICLNFVQKSCCFI
jgi:hypothetical protein